MLREWATISGAVCSTTMALKLGKKVNYLIVNTGDNMPHAWRNVWKLRQRKYRVIALSSMIAGYGTYWEYIEGEKLKPFYMTCSDKAKQRHMNYFFNTIGPVTVNIGYVKEDADRVADFVDKAKIKYKFPILDMSRAECEAVLHEEGFEVAKTGCNRCPKQPDRSKVPEWCL